MAVMQDLREQAVAGGVGQSPLADRAPSAYRLAMLCVLTACAPVVYAHFVNLLGKPHYQYAVLIPLGVWAIWARDLKQLSRGSPSLHWAPLMVLLIGAVGLLAAAWAGSPWLGMTASLLLVLPCLWWTGGIEAWRRGWRGWLLAWAVVPVPLGLDEDLTRCLRTVTTKLSSRVLDELGVLHLSYANVIELPGKSLFIADACSGIHSLYVLLAASLFIAMWFERTLLHTACLLVATFGLVLVENVARLCIVSLAWGRQMDLSQGQPHMVLGAVLFVVSLALVLSSDQFLTFLLPGGKFQVRECFRKSSSAHIYYRDPEPEARRARSFRTLAPHPVQWTTILFLTLPLPLIGAYQAVRFPTSIVPQLGGGDIRLPEFGEDALPETISGFTRVGYEVIRRVEGDPMGRDSQQWKYRRGPMLACVSLDYPYDGLHDPCLCYEAIGWTVTNKQTLPSEMLAKFPKELRGSVAVGRLERSLFGRGLVYFSLADESGDLHASVKPIEPLDLESRGLQRMTAARRPSPNATKAAGASQAFIQFQMLVQNDRPFDAETEQELLALYLDVRRQLQDLVGRQLSGASTAKGLAVEDHQ